MRIGIVPVLETFSGGIYQYSLTMLQALYEGKNDGWEDEFVVFVYKKDHPAVISLNGPGWAIEPLYPTSLKWQIGSVLRQLLGEEHAREARVWLRHLLGRRDLPDTDEVRHRPERSRWFHRYGVEMMLYPAPSSLSFETGIPYVMAIHDLQHRLQPEFPEVSANGEWERREHLFRNGARYATLLLADSEVGKEDILNLYGPYGATSDRVKVLPFLPASYLTHNVSESDRLRARRAYRLPQRYLFYPAQFWPHKNHVRIVHALGLLKQRWDLSIPIVLCGSYGGAIRKRTFREVMSLSNRLGLEDQVYYIGYVPDEDMAGLYGGAVALVMPTFFGPTNIPVLEAWAFGCPVLTSGIRGIQEQVGDAGFKVDPRSVEAIADGIYRLWTDEELRSILAERGRQRLANYTPQDYRKRLVEILEEAKARVREEKTKGVKHDGAG